MTILLNFLPVLLFLAFLFFLDRLHLVRIKTLLICLLWGMACTSAAIFLNSFIAGNWSLDFNFLSHYIAPVIEEPLKALVVFYLLSKKKIGFMIDAAIYGFACGAGFSLIENIWYLTASPQDFTLLTSMIRGLGTAVMHGGTTSMLAIILAGSTRRPANRIPATVIALLSAIALHAAFNSFPLDPVLQTIITITILPLVFVIVFRISTTRLQNWLEIELSSEIEILNMIRKGKFLSTRAGAYLDSVRERFPPETIVDMYCYISLFLELSIKAKRNLMLMEADLPVMIEEDVGPKLKELSHLRKQIGKVGELALAPLIRMSYRNLWQINSLKK